MDCGDWRSHKKPLFYLRTKQVAMVASRLAECVRRGPAAGASVGRVAFVFFLNQYKPIKKIHFF